MEALGADRAVDLRLEEVESSIEGNADVWYITLSMVDLNTPITSIGTALSALKPKAPRTYKRFTVNKQTGEVTSMKIRELSNA